MDCFVNTRVEKKSTVEILNNVESQLKSTAYICDTSSYLQYFHIFFIYFKFILRMLNIYGRGWIRPSLLVEYGSW